MKHPQARPTNSTGYKCSCEPERNSQPNRFGRLPRSRGTIRPQQSNSAVIHTV